MSTIIATEKKQTEAPEKAAPSPGKRDPHLDVMRGWLMILIMITHMQVLDLIGYSTIAYILTFALAAYFFLSGYLYNPAKNQRFGPYIAHKVQTLLLPYGIFFGLSFLWTNTVYAYFQQNPIFGYRFTWGELFSALFGAGKYLFDFPLVPAPIWFLHALFFASILFYFIMKLKKPVLLLAAALILAGITVPLRQALADNPIWLFRLLPPALFFMLCGYLFRLLMTDALRRWLQQNIVTSLFVPMACLMAGLFIMQKARGDLWDITSYWFFLGALISILGCFVFAQSSDSVALRFVGENSLLYLGLHPLILMLPPIAALPAWMMARGFDGLAVFIGYFMIAFALISLLVLVARWVTARWLAWRKGRELAY